MKRAAEVLQELLKLKNDSFESRSNEELNTVTMIAKSPSSELGSLLIEIDGNDIAISVRGFHTHIDPNTIRSEGSSSIVSHAMRVVENIFDGKFYFFEVCNSKGIQSAGGGPCKLNEDERKLFYGMFGSGVLIKEWNWYGAL